MPRILQLLARRWLSIGFWVLRNVLDFDASDAAAFAAQPPESSGKQKSGDNCAENAQCWVARRKRVQGGEDDGRGHAYGNEGG